MDAKEWAEMGEMTKSTIMLTLNKTVHYNVNEAAHTSYEIWENLCGMFEQKSIASQVYWLKKLVDL